METRARGISGRAGKQTTARRAEYEVEAVSHEDSNEEYDEYGKSEGKTNYNKNLNTEFIADLEATSHIVNESLILSNFKKSE